MAKFCSKCGMKLNEQTGKCPNCDEKTKMDTASSDSNISINGNPKEDQNIKKTNGEQEVKKESKKKTIVVITIVIVVLLIGIGVGIGVFMVHNEKNANVPNNGEIQETQSTAGTETTTPNEENEEVDLGSNYEVPEFDAEAYFRENTTLKSTFDVASSQSIHTESEAYDSFVERGFDGSQVMYEYTMDGTYLGENEISRSSSSKHPMVLTSQEVHAQTGLLIHRPAGEFDCLGIQRLAALAAQQLTIAVGRMIQLVAAGGTFAVQGF